MSLLALLMATAGPQGGIPFDPDTEIQGLMMFGQSNTRGLNPSTLAAFNAFLLSEYGIDVTVPLDRVWMIERNAGPTAGKDKLDITTNQSDGMGIEISIGHLWQQMHPQGELYIMKDGRNGQDIDWWSNGSGFPTLSDLHDSAVAHATTAGKTLKTVGLYVLQGEADASQPANYWRGKVTDIFNGLYDQNLIDQDTKIVIGGIALATTLYTTMLAEHQSIPGIFPNAVYQDNSTQPREDQYHFTAPVQWVELAYNAFNYIWNYSIPKPFSAVPPHV